MGLPLPYLSPVGDIFVWRLLTELKHTLCLIALQTFTHDLLAHFQE